MSISKTCSAGLGLMGGFLGLAWATTWRVPVDRAHHERETGVTLMDAVNGDLDRALTLSVPGSVTQHSIAQCTIAFNEGSITDPRGCVADRLSDHVAAQQAILDQSGFAALALLSMGAIIYAAGRFWPQNKTALP